MIHRQPSFDPSEQASLAEIGRRLHAQGWAVTVAWMLAEWHEFSLSVDGYDLSIDDYTNDLIARDGLERTLAECQQPLRTKLLSWIEVADQEFIANTQDDVDGALGRFSDVDESSGWWWKRRPATGPLAEFLTNRSRT
jgi:hypothetical protein